MFINSRSGFYEYDPSHGFESDMTAEEIFNMFFGGGFPSQTVYVRRGGGDPTSRFRNSAHSHRTYHSHHSTESREVNIVIFLTDIDITMANIIQ